MFNKKWDSVGAATPFVALVEQIRVVAAESAVSVFWLFAIYAFRRR